MYEQTVTDAVKMFLKLLDDGYFYKGNIMFGGQESSFVTAMREAVAREEENQPMITDQMIAEEATLNGLDHAALHIEAYGVWECTDQTFEEALQEAVQRVARRQYEN
jgi:hypothetical protein